MKNSLRNLLCVLIIFTGLGCKKNSALPGDQLKMTIKEVMTMASSECGSGNSNQSMQWLKDILEKGEEDRDSNKHMGMYMGKVFLTSYQNKPVFHITMALGSGGIARYIYDCNGNDVKIMPNDLGFEQDGRKSTLLYSNLPAGM